MKVVRIGTVPHLPVKTRKKEKVYQARLSSTGLVQGDTGQLGVVQPKNVIEV